MGAADTHLLAEHGHKRATRACAHSASFIVTIKRCVLSPKLHRVDFLLGAFESN